MLDQLLITWSGECMDTWRHMSRQFASSVSFIAIGITRYLQHDTACSMVRKMIKRRPDNHMEVSYLIS